jgi:drug/metabolite transporter (DMT)-like permease
VIAEPNSASSSRKVWVLPVLVALTILSWSSAFPAIRVGLQSFGPVELSLLRFMIATIPAGLYLLFMRPALPTKEEWYRLVPSGVLAVSLYTVFLNLGERTVPAGAASFVISTGPLFTALLAGIFLGEKFGIRGWLGSCVAFCGIGLIALGEGKGGVFNPDALWIVASALCAAISFVLQKPLFKTMSPLTVTAWCIIIGMLALTPFFTSAFVQAKGGTTASWLALIWLGIVPGALAYAVWTTVLSILPAARATNFLYLVPPTATLFGFLLLGELPSSMALIGGLISLAGVAIVNLNFKRKAALESAAP